MERLSILAEMFVDDVNKENSIVIELFGTFVDFLFKILMWAGIPFLVYVLLEFAGLF